MGGRNSAGELWRHNTLRFASILFLLCLSSAFVDLMQAPGNRSVYGYGAASSFMTDRSVTAYLRQLI